MSYKRQSNDIELIQLSNYVKPEIKEYLGKRWVLNGDKNSFFQYIIDRYNGSVTNESVINTFCELIYGKGISINGQNDIYDELNEIFNKREQKKCIADRKIFGQYAMQILRAKGGGIAKILHLPVNKLGMELSDDNGEINNVYYCDDWRNPTKYTPKRYPIFKGKMTESIMVKMVQPYKPGKFYFSDPDYLASLQYAELEEEISNFSINHIKNNLSFGYVVNMNNGAALTPEQKDQIEFKIKQKLTGSSNAGNFILSFNDGKENEVTVIPLNTNAEAHQQWESLQKIASEKIIISHGAFPALFGMETANGFASNADELTIQSKLVQDYQITPIQNEFIDELATILELTDLETDLSFIPLRDTYKSTETVEEEPIDDTIDDEEVVEDNVALSGFDPSQPRAKDGKWTAEDQLAWDMENFDYGSTIYNETPEEAQAAEDEIREKNFKKKNYDKNWAKTYKEAKEKLLKEIEKAQKEIEKWQSKVYKKGAGSGFVGDELSGREVNYDIVNENRRTRAIKRNKSIIKESVDFLKELGLTDLEIRENTKVNLSSHNVEMLINLGEDINYDEWDLVDDRRCDEITLKESDLNTVFEFASVPKTSDKKSQQDTSLFKIRYRYAGSPKGEREFCNKLMLSNKLYRAEDLDANYNYNEELAPEGEDSYNIFKFKGGVNCKHWWQRVIFLKKGNTKIGVNQAKKMILALEPEQRADAKWQTNDKRVAQVAEQQNNYWSLKPNYRDSGVTEIQKD